MFDEIPIEEVNSGGHKAEVFRDVIAGKPQFSFSMFRLTRRDGRWMLDPPIRPADAASLSQLMNKAQAACDEWKKLTEEQSTPDDRGGRSANPEE